MKIIPKAKNSFQYSLAILINSNNSKIPQYNIYVNDQLVNKDPVKVEKLSDFQEVRYYHDTASSIENISVELLNKTSNDTKVDAAGQITEDLYIVVKYITVDGHSLDLNKISHYTNSQHIQKTYGFMGFNGKLKFKIQKNLLYTQFLSRMI